MDWSPAFAIIGIVIGLFGLMIYFINKLDQDVRAQGSRIDQLYTMFVDLLKHNESKKISKLKK